MEEHVGEKSCSICAVGIIEEREPIWKKRSLHIILASSATLTVGLIFEFVLNIILLAQILFVAVVILSGFDIAKNGLRSLLKKRLDMNLLIMVAAIGAFLIGHGEEGAAIVFLFFIAEFLEEHAIERTRRSVGALMKLAPDITTVRRNGKEVEVHTHDIKVNEVILVKPGNKVPLDGVVVKGVSSVNQAPITGESIPVTKQPGDEVYAGTINCEGFLEVKVMKKSDQTMLSKIAKLVEEAQKRKSPTEKFVDRFAKYYTPSVLFLALLVATIPTLVFNLPFNDWFYKALVLLVVSCPCALAISTPVSIVSGITSGARNGVLIKGGRYVEEINQIDVFAFDKTGTLTEGKPEVTDIIGLGNPDREVLSIAASLEAMSEHPIAKAITYKASVEGVKTKNVTNFKSIAGKGVYGKIGDQTYYLGSAKIFNDMSLTIPEEAGKLEEEGKTVILVGNRRGIVGVIAVMDKIRDGTVRAISSIRKSGIRTVMITGDNRRTAKTIAERIGIDEFHAELLPEEKVKIIEDLRKNKGKVAMVGDGVNDAPALARADVGIAMGTIGSDVALETADVALMQDDLSKLPYLVNLSKKTVKVMKTNIFASILIKGSFAVLAFPGIVTLWMAVGIGDMGLSLAVVLNAMALSMLKPK
ncbi:cation-translocating P-type ATPase [Candidatus Hecatella orcuttiae]|jgi:Cd2+/Zn2+-exporting ATPase|uniref:heavy metal translocating P-type ATPase n=1 Tax=Candidatus Hecatella orcuttiae TaxID=1935119 RepID=UPI0028681EF7|nr:cation-translocating P-type ATPase [Candidatus Hecatella orcuttiae]